MRLRRRSRRRDDPHRVRKGVRKSTSSDRSFREVKRHGADHVGPREKRSATRLLSAPSGGSAFLPQSPDSERNFITIDGNFGIMALVNA